MVDISLAQWAFLLHGAILEVKAKNVEIGSITGGGRYDNLTGIFGFDGMVVSAFSFGADRIYDVMSQLDLFPKRSQYGGSDSFINFGEEFTDFVLSVISRLRP